MQISFLGFGLIAGAIAQAIRADPPSSVRRMVAWSPSGQGPSLALADGVIDLAAASGPEAIAGADLVILAAPATVCLSMIDAMSGEWSAAMAPGVVVTDVASTKAMLVGRADAAGIRFVGGHPMAGLEIAGYQRGTAGLFVDRPWVIVPGAEAGPGDIARVRTVVDACSARSIVMDAAAHDRAVSAVSHLPLVAAAAIVESMVGPTDDPSNRWSIAAALAAGGWRDTTRVAHGDPAMGAAIAATNPAELAARVRELQAVLDQWLAELERPGGPDEVAIRARLTAARAALEAER